EGSQPFQVSGRRKMDAAFALDRFQHDGDGLAVDKLGNGIEIAEWNMTKACQHRLDALVVLGLRRCAQSSHGSTMKTIEHRDDLVAFFGLPMEPGQLNGRLVGLRAAVAEKASPFETASFTQRLR